MAAEVCAGTSSTSDKERMESTVTAMNMIANGRRNVVCGEIPTAVNQFQEACKLLAKAYGETAKECAEAYFYYGQALLDLARMETGVLGNALQGVPDTDEDEENKSSDDMFEKGDSLPVDEREKLRDEVYEAMADPEADKSKVKDVMKEIKPTSGETLEMAMEMEECDECKPDTLPEGKVESEEQDKAKDGEGEKETENKPDVEMNGTDEKQEKETVDIKIEEDNAAQKDSKKEKSKPSENGVKNTIEELDEYKKREKKSDQEKKQSEVKEMPEDPKVEGKEETKTVEPAKEDSVDKDDKEDSVDEEDSVDKDASDGEEEQIKSDEKEEQDEDCDEPQDANGEESKKESNEGSESTEKENGTEEEEGEEEEGEETLDEGETSQDEKEAIEGEENADDVSNLQLAWEMLELAKVIYLKEDTKESKIKAAEAHLKLGEVSLETEQYEQAVEDFNQCLKIQKEFMEPEDRALAETYYQLGLAFGFNKQYDQAIESYKTAIKTIEDKIAKLTQFIEEKSSEKGKEPVDFDDPVTQAIQEIKDLNDILPDIHTKIEDTEEEKKQVDELKVAAKEVIGFTSSSVPLGQTIETSSTTKSDVKVMDISHLIKRKRKPEEEEAGEELKELKKTRQEDGSGDASTKENEKDLALEKDKLQDVPMEEANPAEVAAS
ncbi:hypothetical protein ACJMK2_042699 [Sinanodonta woodiana]|uniref:Tetratricopeptide SHNi-TPR domain-containing protein n=1 Tax=Sinanodonta woodiana TaxID=1069815 RepID=A0ABD3W9N5_SINWO